MAFDKPLGVAVTAGVMQTVSNRASPGTFKRPHYRRARRLMSAERSHSSAHRGKFSGIFRAQNRQPPMASAKEEYR